MIDNYNKLTIGKYLELVEIIEDDTLADIDKNVEIIALLDDKEVDVIYDLPLTEFNEKIQMTSFLYEEPKPLQVSTVYKLGKMELETCLNLNDLTTAQFIDYQTYVKDDKKLVELLSVFLIPKGHKYNKDYDIVEVQNVIRENMPVTQAMGLSAFFLLLSKSLLKASLTYSIKKLKKMMRKEKDMKKKEMMKQAIHNLQLNGLG
jgi:hypothetical protein